jgi:mRNA-degrading endonuclease YafQ of YafQ-DinJ toxin-antitoxin module
MSSGPKYKGSFVNQFRRGIVDIDKDHLKSIIDDLLTDPYHGHETHLLHRRWEGFRAADYDAKRRIIYRVCEECIAQQWQSTNPLDCCAEETCDPLRVTFVDFGDYHASAGSGRLSPPYKYKNATDEPPA